MRTGRKSDSSVIYRAVALVVVYRKIDRVFLPVPGQLLVEQLGGLRWKLTQLLLYLGHGYVVVLKLTISVSFQTAAHQVTLPLVVERRSRERLLCEWTSPIRIHECGFASPRFAHAMGEVCVRSGFGFGSLIVVV